LLIEATLSNLPNRIFDKFLRGVINTQHVLNNPVAFFPEAKPRPCLEAYNVYHLIITHKDWSRGLVNHKIMSEIIFEENYRIFNLLFYSEFKDIRIVDRKYLAKMIPSRSWKRSHC